MSEEDKKLQKHLVDEMMKVYETNPNVMLYMQSLMENYERLQQENKQLKKKIKLLEDYGEAVGERRNQLYDKIDKAIDYCELNKEFTPRLQDILEILEGDKK